MAAALQRKEAQARDAFADALVRQVLDGMEVQVPDFVAEVLENAQMMADDARRYVDRMAN